MIFVGTWRIHLFKKKRKTFSHKEFILGCLLLGSRWVRHCSAVTSVISISISCREPDWNSNSSRILTMFLGHSVELVDWWTGGVAYVLRALRVFVFMCGSNVLLAFITCIHFWPKPSAHSNCHQQRTRLCAVCI